MGHVINPISFRLGYSRYWNSVWSLSNTSNYSQLTNQDFLIKSVTLNYFKKLFYHPRTRFIFLVNNLRIIRKFNKTQIIIHLYDSLHEMELNSTIKKNLRRLLLKWRIFRAWNWKSFNWIPTASVFEAKKLINTDPSAVTLDTISLKTKYQYTQWLFNKKTINNSMIDDFYTVFKRFYVFQVRQQLVKFWWIFKASVCMLLSPILPNMLPNNIILVGINSRTLSAEFISNFIVYHLEHRYYLFQILKVLWGSLNTLIKSRILYGYRVKFSGRFKKNEKAVYMTKNVGSIGRYDIKRGVDYSYKVARMRLGVTGVKVWLAYSSVYDMRIKTDITGKMNPMSISWLISKKSKNIIPSVTLKYSNFYRIFLKNNIEDIYSTRSASLIELATSKNLLARYSYIY